MRCLWSWGEGLLLSTVWKCALTLLIQLLIVFSTNALLHSFIDILVKYALWASVTALVCVPFISHKRIYFQSLLLHTLHGFSVNLFFISLLMSMQNLTQALKFSKVSSWQFVTNYLAIITYTQMDPKWIILLLQPLSHEEVKSLRIPDKASIFTAELVALNLALDIVWHSRHKNLSYSQTLVCCMLAIENVQAECGHVISCSKTIQH